MVKNLPASAEGTRDAGSILGLRRSPGVGNDDPFQYCLLGNPMEWSLVGYSPWGCKELDMTGQLSTAKW